MISPRHKCLTSFVAVCLLFAASLAMAQQRPLSITSARSYRFLSGQPVQIQLTATGGTVPYTWKLLQRPLPDGLKLDPKLGLITGTTNASGEFQIPFAVTDASSPAQEQQGTLILTLVASLEVKWKTMPQVRDGGISGSIIVTNNTGRTLNLTVIVLAVNEINKAFALGYQHFDCKPNADTPIIPFSSSLPFGSYLVHVDAVAEDAPRNHIYRSRLQTPNRLTLTQH